MLSDRTARVFDDCFLYALRYFERDRDGLEGEAVRVVGAGPRRGHIGLVRSWRGLMRAQRVDGVLRGTRIWDPAFLRSLGAAGGPLRGPC